MNREAFYAFIEPNYRTSVCFSKSMEGLQSRLEKLRATLSVLNRPEELERLMPLPMAVALIGDKEPWIRRMVYVLRRKGIHPILVGADPADYGENVSGVALNRQTAVEHTLQYFRAAGRCRPAAVGADPRDTNDNVRVRAFLRHGEKLGMWVSERDIYTAETQLDGCIEEFLDHAGDYDSVLCVNDFVGVALILAAKRRGIAVPEQLFVAASGNQILGRCISPMLTTCTLDYFKVGVQAADIWAHLLKHSSISALSVSIPCTILCRESTACFPLPEYRVIEEAPEGAEDDMSIPPSVLKMRRLEACLLRCDAMDFNILRCVLRGMSNHQIAEELFASQGTVQYRLKKIYQDAGLCSKQELCEQLAPLITNPNFAEEITEHII